MKILGLITEYNPFHNGHLYHIEKSKDITESDFTVAVMSGNFVQRGEPAVLDKILRTKMCLLAGVDLVIELPVFFATASAESFAYGAVKILDRSGIVDSICFGSESGDLEELKKFTNIISSESRDFINVLKAGLNKGYSYPKARASAAEYFMECPAKYMDNPNNILGAEYLKALDKMNSSIKPFTIKRCGAGYHSGELTNEISSASAMRRALSKGALQDLRGLMPGLCFEILEKNYNEGRFYTDFNVLSHIFQYALKNMDAGEIKKISDVSEGLENRILKCAGRNFFLEDILSDLKTKRYTLSRLRRILLHIILDIKSSDFDLAAGPGYIRVLGFRRDRSFLLSELLKKSSLPVITNLKNAGKVLDEKNMAALQKEIRSTDIYYLSQVNHRNLELPTFIEYRNPMVMI